MNIITDPYESFWDYEGPKNVLVVPTTLYVKKTTEELTVVNELSKEAFKKYPALKKRWGYLVSIGVSYPTYRSSETILLGLPTREHYASNDDEIMIDSSLVYLADLAESMPEELFYITDFWGKDKTVDFLGATKNIVFLDYSNKGNHD